MKNQSSLKKIHSRKTGKASDKWDIYIEIYEKTFSPFRNQELDILEIGVQNGGSLETWGKFFENARIIVGCDIDTKCAELSFDDSRINIVVGDATSEETFQKIHKLSNEFDIVIEDGSHCSHDIIKTFSDFFPKLRAGGIYIAEDLHCSYWEEWDGGLNHPYSGIEYFKALCDCLNSNHWHREDIDQISYMNKISSHYGIHTNNDLLDSISSIEFYDSICIIKKAQKNQLSRINFRVIGGEQELVCPSNFDAPKTMPICKQNTTDLTGLADFTEKVKILTEYNKKLITDKAFLAQRLKEIQNSRSWKFTKPLRSTKASLIRIANFTKYLQIKAIELTLHRRCNE